MSDSASNQKPSQQSNFKLGLTTACIVCVMLLTTMAGCNQVLVSHAAEITPSTPPIVENGNLAFLRGLKPTGSSIPGIFAHIKGTTASAGDLSLQLFDPFDHGSFVRTPTVDFPVLAGEAIKAMAFDASTDYLYAEFELSSLKGGIRASKLTYDLQTKSFKSGLREVVLAPSASSIQQLITSDDGKVRYCINDGTKRILYMLTGNTASTLKEIPYSNKRLLPQMLKVGKYAIYFTFVADEFIFVDESNPPQPANLVRSSQIALFPVAAIKDTSSPCSEQSCYAIVVGDDPDFGYYLDRPELRAGTSSVQYTFGLPLKFLTNLIVQIPNQKFVVLASPTKFTVIEIGSGSFTERNDWNLASYSNYVSGTGVAGEFDPAQYPYAKPVMILTQEGSTFRARMFAFQQVSCASKDASGYCVACPNQSQLSANKMCFFCPSGCQTCNSNPAICDTCLSTHLLYQKNCYTCAGVSNPALLLEGSSPQCVDSTLDTYKSGYRSFQEQGTAMLEKCTPLNCNQCTGSKDTCTACSDSYEVVSGNCSPKNSNPPGGDQSGGGQSGGDQSGGDQSGGGQSGGDQSGGDQSGGDQSGGGQSGGGQSGGDQSGGDQSGGDQSGGKPGDTPGPKSPDQPNPTPTPSPSSAPVLSVKVYRKVIENRLDLIFPDNQSTNIRTVQLYDLNKQKTYTCAEVGCKTEWEGRLLTISFDSNIEVTSGQLTIVRRATTTIRPQTISPSDPPSRRLLQLVDDDILIPNVTVMGRSWFTVCITILQVLLFISRTVVSALLFWKYPRLAMAADYLVTGCLVLYIIQGPLIISADLMFQTFATVKLSWYRISNFLRTWDPHTTFADTLPNHAEHGVYNAFLDNYCANLVGFVALAVCLGIAHWTSGWLLHTKRVTGRTHAAATCVREQYGWKYFLAKAQANSLEMLVYVLISFAKADASSKSIIGIVLAVLLLLALCWISVGSTLWLDQLCRTSEPPTQQAVLRLHTEEAPMVQADSHERRTTNPSPSSAKWSSKVLASQTGRTLFQREWFAYSTVGVKEYRPTWKGLLPVATLSRDLVFAILALNHAKSAITQMVILICIQAGYISYFWLSHQLSNLLEISSLLGFNSCMMLFLILKAISTSSSLSDSNLQNIFGSLIGIIGAITFLVLLCQQVLGLIYCYRSTAPNQVSTDQKKPSISNVADKDRNSSTSSPQLDGVQVAHNHGAISPDSLNLQVPDEKEQRKPIQVNTILETIPQEVNLVPLELDIPEEKMS